MISASLFYPLLCSLPLVPLVQLFSYFHVIYVYAYIILLCIYIKPRIHQEQKT